MSEDQQDSPSDRGSAPLPLALPAARDEADHRHEDGRADDRPDDWKALPADPDDEQLRQVQRVGHPHPHERADEAERDRHEAATMAVPGDGLADRAAYARDQQKDQK